MTYQHLVMVETLRKDLGKLTLEKNSVITKEFSYIYLLRQRIKIFYKLKADDAIPNRLVGMLYLTSNILWKMFMVHLQHWELLE